MPVFILVLFLNPLCSGSLLNLLFSHLTTFILHFYFKQYKFVSLQSNNNAHVLHTDSYTLDPSNREGSLMPPAYDYVSRPGNDDVPGPADR